MSRPYKLPPRWEALRPEDIGTLESELSRETCPGHPLHQSAVRAVYRRYPFDDVLFEVTGIDYPYYVVHLTWSKESDPNWPYITRFRSMEDFCNKYEMTRYLEKDHPDWETEKWRFYDPE